MFRSLPRVIAAIVLVCAFVLLTVPAQAQPRDPGAGPMIDISWVEAALGWLENLLGGSEGLDTLTTGSSTKTDTGTGGTLRSGPCIDPYGGCTGG